MCKSVSTQCQKIKMCLKGANHVLALLSYIFNSRRKKQRCARRVQKGNLVCLMCDTHLTVWYVVFAWHVTYQKLPFQSPKNKF